MKTDTGRIRAFTLIELPAVRQRKREAFTLIELLVVIGIIALLIGILIPVISKVRTKGYVADSKNFISQLSAAIEQYHSDQRAYPGPLSNADIWNGTPSNGAIVSGNLVKTPPTGYDLTAPASANITMSENLTLGLLGGLTFSTTGAIAYDPSQVGLGPMNLNQANPKRFPPYVDPANLDWQTTAAGKTGHYFDDASPAGAADTQIPEFLDRFPDGMPILYLRARVGQPLISTTDANYGSSYNGVITNNVAGGPNNLARQGQYDISQIIAYTQKQSDGSYIGTGKTLKPSDYIPPFTGPGLPHGLATVVTGATLNKSVAGYTFPYDAFPYFQSASSPASPRQKDGYILISPGPDRVYGTQDDIDSFGDVLP